MHRKNQKGFTLIELLVVVAIIGLLAAIVLTAVTGVRKKARGAIRQTDMRQIANALEQYYYANNGTYPNTLGAWRSECPAWGGYTPDQVIPGLTPTYMPRFPSNPTMNDGTNKANSIACYLYFSNGTDYKLLNYNADEYTASDYAAIPAWFDPQRDHENPLGPGPDPCKVDGTGYFVWAIYTPGAACW
jgi:prepilin-type N-terminal cleavage/methylation domain-containing protein